MKKQLSLICALEALEDNEEEQQVMRETNMELEIKEENEDPEFKFPDNLEIKKEINCSDPESFQDPEYISCRNLADPEISEFPFERKNLEELEVLEQKEKEDEPENLKIPQQKGRFDNNDYEATYVKQM